MGESEVLVSITPHGRVVVSNNDRLRKVFDESVAHGLLHLATAELGATKKKAPPARRKSK